ncbi:type II toxin-antitoxin system VapC family toxin [Microbacterium sp. A84]|uniref:type II toxin-antitoxin system VapC family toxin n=1 Tax=Microbacterium sp. A84 TaxID=3450715 RepID=UPI003F42E282
MDTSALVPLLFDEPTSARCQRLWATASTRVTARTTFVEASAAVAAAERGDRIDAAEAESARAVLEQAWRDIVVVEFEEGLMRAAAACAREYRLRRYDSIHCASAMRVAGIDVLAASGDQALLSAWQQVGLAVADTASA